MIHGKISYRIPNSSLQYVTRDFVSIPIAVEVSQFSVQAYPRYSIRYKQRYPYWDQFYIIGSYWTRFVSGTCSQYYILITRRHSATNPVYIITCHTRERQRACDICDNKPILEVATSTTWCAQVFV